MSTYAITKELIEKYNVEIVDHWDAPETNDARIIGMPNIPKPVQGKGCQPRTILGPKTWNHMRRRCYALADDTCEICGTKPDDKRYRHCLERGTEVLTTNGWKPIEYVTTSDTVAQFSPEDESVSWAKPTSTTSKYEEKIYRFGYKKGFSVGVSSGHRMLVQNGRSNKYTNIEAKDLEVGKWQKIPAAGKGYGLDSLSADERLLIAMQADGRIQKNKNTAFCRISVKKERKIERLKQLAKECSFVTHQSTYSTKHYGDYFTLSFTVPYSGKNFFDTFKSPQMSYTKANEFIDELVKWDGWEGERNGQPGRCYYSSEKSNIDFVQAVCAQAGLGSHLTITHRKTRDFGTHISNNLKPAYNLEIKKTNSYGLTTMKKELVEYNDEVFCISVPSSYFVARTRGGDVFITGNCHEVFSIDYKSGVSRFERCICLCYDCHILSIHNGRALTFYKNNSPLMNKESLLRGAENAFKIAKEWNDAHEEKLKLYGNFLNYLKVPTLEKEMLELIEKYKPEFYISTEGSKDSADWGSWKVIIGNNEYPSPYQSEKDWEDAMEDASKNDTDRMVKTPLRGEVFDKLDELLKEPVENLNIKPIDKKAKV